MSSHPVVNCGEEQVWRERGPHSPPPSSSNGKSQEPRQRESGEKTDLSLTTSCERAGNLEALIKSAIAHLYSESRSGQDDSDSDVLVQCSEKAAQLFMATDDNHVHRPFTWLLYRSPWAPGGSCCKAAVFRHVQSVCDREEETTGNRLFCVAKALSFNEVRCV